MTDLTEFLTVETRLRWEEDDEGRFRLFAGLVMIGEVYEYTVYKEKWIADMTNLSKGDQFIYPSGAEARAALFASAVEDLKYVG